MKSNILLLVTEEKKLFELGGPRTAERFKSHRALAQYLGAYRTTYFYAALYIIALARQAICDAQLESSWTAVDYLNDIGDVGLNFVRTWYRLSRCDIYVLFTNNDGKKSQLG